MKHPPYIGWIVTTKGNDMKTTILSCASGFDYRIEQVASIFEAVEDLKITGLPLLVLYPSASLAQKAYDLLRAQHLQDKPSYNLFHLEVPQSKIQPQYCRRYIRAAKIVVTDFDSFLQIEMNKSYTAIVPVLPEKAADMHQVRNVCDHVKDSSMCPIMYFFEDEENKKDRVRGGRLRRVLKARQT